MYLFCNLKNKLNKDEMIRYKNAYEDLTRRGIKLVLFPANPFLCLFDSKKVCLGSQDITSFKDKTITGEITGEQLSSVGCNYVLVGHSERRVLKNEINIDFINKVDNAQENGLKVIYCVGESRSDRDNSNTYAVLDKQISEVLNNVKVKNIIIAYEPVWCVDTGVFIDKASLEEAVKYIKDIIFKKYEVKVQVVYGGSVNSNNVGSLKETDGLDGFLIYKSALDIEELQKILDILAR